MVDPVVFEGRLAVVDGWLRFVPLLRDLAQPNWWRSSELTEEVVARAVDIAKRTGVRWLEGPDLLAAYDGPPRTLQDELDAATTLAIEPLLAIGCTAAPDRAAIDDWIASRADKLDAKHLLVADHRARSALAFLTDFCARVNVDLGVDVSAVDAKLKEQPREDVRPWGVPASHWWWRQGLDYDSYRWPVYNTRQPLENGRSWLAWFDSYDQYREYIYYRVLLVDGDVPGAKIMARVGTPMGPEINENWRHPDFERELYRGIAGIAADGVSNTTSGA